MTLELRIIAALIGVALLVGGLFAGKAWYDHYQAMNAKLEATAGVQEGTQAVTTAAGTSIQAADSVLREIVTHRTEYVTKIEELKRENPEIAAYSALCIPRELRRAACERRATRHGLASAEAGCGRFDTAADCSR